MSKPTVSPEMVKERVRAFIELNRWFKITYGVSLSAMVTSINLKNPQGRNRYKRLYKEYYDVLSREAQIDYSTKRREE